MKVYSEGEVNELFREDPNPANWTVVIPAAGKGTRLGYSKPKMLYPLLGRTILDRLIDLLSPHFGRFVVVLSPESGQQIVPHLEKRLSGRFNAPIIENSRGMADSISRALPHISTPHTLIIWGDQAAISSNTIVSVQRIHEFSRLAKLTLPLAKREHPYVHYETDEGGRLSFVLERREGKEMPEIGESDCGVFAVDTYRLREILEGEMRNGVVLSEATREWNFLPLLPKFETTEGSVFAYRMESVEETVGVNDTNDAALLENYFRKRERAKQKSETKESKEKLRVAMFSGGRGTGAITEALLRYPDIELTLLVNAYDDGLSTGLLRRFIPGMLGPSDIRKNISRFVGQRNDASSRALHFLLEYRFPETLKAEQALLFLRNFIDIHSEGVGEGDVLADLLNARNALSLFQSKRAIQYLYSFLEYYSVRIREYPEFSFGDVSFGNLLFAGCFLVHRNDFNTAIADFSHFAEIGDRVLNVTNGENRVLVAIKENGTFLHDEASVVGPQDDSCIQEIFLLPEYLDEEKFPLGPYKIDAIRHLRGLEKLPTINLGVKKVLEESDIIIYGPGTQYSSLFPSYLTSGVAEAIEANTRAEKIFIGNIMRDYDILGEDATTLVKAFLWNMSRKVEGVVACQNLISGFFFQKPEARISTETSYVPFDAKEFAYPLEKVVWIDWEEEKGKHSGSKTIRELLSIVERQFQKRIRHVSQKVSVIVPALNEEKTIKHVLHDLQMLSFSDLGLSKEVLVVDGSSTDKTFKKASEHSDVRVFRLPKNLGRGRALRFGLEKARGDIVVFFPADGEYKTSDIRRVVSTLLNDEFSVVFGSRAFRAENLDRTLRHVYGKKLLAYWLSKYGGMLLSILTLLFYKRFVSDPLTSLKGFNARVFRGMRFEQRGVDFDMELLAKLLRSGYNVLEVPIHYQARTVAEGKKTTVWDGIGCLSALFRFSRWRPRVVSQGQPKSLLLKKVVSAHSHQ